LSNQFCYFLSISLNKEVAWCFSVKLSSPWPPFFNSLLVCISIPQVSWKEITEINQIWIIIKVAFLLMIFRGEGVFLRYFYQKLTTFFFNTYCLLQLAMCRSVLLGGCPVVTGLRLLSCYFVCKGVSCGKVTESACSEFTCCQRNLQVTQVGETVFSSGTVMSCLSSVKVFPVSSVGHVLQCIQIWPLATAVRTTESTRNLSVLRIQNVMSQQRSLDVNSKVTINVPPQRPVSSSI